MLFTGMFVGVAKTHYDAATVAAACVRACMRAGDLISSFAGTAQVVDATHIHLCFINFSEFVMHAST